MTVFAFEGAGSVRKAAGLAVDVDPLTRRAIERAYADDRVTDLLAVGADILHGRRADEPGDPRHALDPRVAFGPGARDEPVPRFARGDREKDTIAFCLDRDATERHVDDEPREACVADNHVASAAEHEDRLAAGIGVGDGGLKLHERRDPHEACRRTTDAQRRERREGNAGGPGNGHPRYFADLRRGRNKTGRLRLPVLPLPIDPILPDIVASLRDRPSLVLEAPPGAGKTTRVPRAMLDAGMAEKGEIIVLEPRRLATRMAARRVADELGQNVGEAIGYQVRFEDVSSARTRVRFVTEGVLTRRLLGDPTLAGVSAVLLDEFHERHLHGDVALALLLRLQQKRKDLKLVVMSATLESKPVADFLACPTLRAEGRRFEVALEHLPAMDDRPLPLQVASAVRRLATEGLDGDVLVFLPGAGEIRRVSEACAALVATHDLLILPLHGDLSPQEQDRAVRPADRRKVILATNVAESSITIDGVVAVIDSGLVRVARQAPWSGLNMLRVEKTSRASATQRAGRAGRTRPGRCLRLYTKADHDTRPEHEQPEIQRIDLAQTLLELCAADARDLTWFEAPREDAIVAAEKLLVRLGALDAADKRTVTAIGKRMLRFPLHPRQARLLLEAESRGLVDDGSVLAALVAERDIRASSKAQFGGGGGGPGRGRDIATEDSDLICMLDLFREAEASGFSQSALRAIGLDAGATHAVDRARKHLARMCGASSYPKGCTSRPPSSGGLAVDAALRLCVLAGYPDRVAKRRKQGSRDLALAEGGMAELSEASAVRDAEWLVAVDAESQASRALVRVASAIEPDWLIELFVDTVREVDEVTWNAHAERVEVKSRMFYEGLLLEESKTGRAPEAEITRVLAAAALEKGARKFAPEDALDAWLARARFAASVDASIAAPKDEDVRAALVEMCEGKKSFAELRHSSLLDTLKARVSHAKCARIEHLAPEKLNLASGRSVRITYDDGKPPWIESFLQDFFGTTETPRVGGGATPLVLHLLAPNKRAVQVTTDLSGFWIRHYPSVRKEMARKYPRHNWPDEPHTAVARLRRPPR